MGIVFYLYQAKPNLERDVLVRFCHLIDPKYFMHGPFNYDVHEDIIKPKQHMALNNWELLHSFCNQFSIVPPTLSTLPVSKPSLNNRNK